MRQALGLLVVVLLAAGCYESSDTTLDGQGTPGPNAADSVTTPDGFEPMECNVDGDCADLVETGPCEVAVCSNSRCQVEAAVVGAVCDDPAVTPDVCQRSTCQPAVEGGLACVATAAPDGTPCGDFQPACGTPVGCMDGVCVDPCDDGNPCTVGTCMANGCAFEPISDVACNDNDGCTANDMCVEGECVGEVVCECDEDSDCMDQDDGNPCTGEPYCKPNGECGIDPATVIECEPTGFEPCQVNECDPEIAACVHKTADDGTQCEDGNVCTDGDTCLDGACTQYAQATCEFICDDEVDEDGDDLTDCDDTDCWGLGGCPQPECGDGECQPLANEDCATCTEDCGECPPECGDGELQPEIDEECDDGNTDPGDGCDGACKVEPVAADAGDLVITEILSNPDVVTDSVGEWFELYNATDADIDINAWTITDEGQDQHRIFAPGGVVVPAGGYAVLGVNGDDAVNGGVVLAYAYSSFNLANSGDEIILMSGETVVDQVAWDDGTLFPNEKGKSLSLDPASLDAVANDDGANWCLGRDVFGAGDMGTPGMANPACPTCGDGTCNGDETCATCSDDCGCEAGFVCLDGQCAELLTNGAVCGVGEDCASGFCVDGVCCDTACDALCEACNVEAAEGTCTPYAVGTDPDDECGICTVCNGGSSCTYVAAGEDIKDDCEASPASTCGLDGACAGGGKCRYWAAGTECAAATCGGTTLFDASECDGLGECVAGGSASCCPYVCAEAATCLDMCEVDDDCCAGNTCLANLCVPIP